MEMTNLTIILGAGASTGSTQHGITSQSDIIPPLTKDLFLPQYDFVLGKYGDVKSGTVGLSSSMTDGKSLEDRVKDELGTLSNYGSLSPHRKRSFNQLPLYLQDLFGYISSELNNKTFYSRFVNIIFDYIDKKSFKVTFITLNYDLLLDFALERVVGKQFEGFGNYTDESHKWVLLKPHGSVNWFRQINRYTQTGSNFESWNAIVRDLNVSSDLSTELRFVNLAEFREGFVDGIPHYPALAIPNTEYSPLYPLEEFHTVLKERLAECHNYLIIGFSAYDQDLLEVLNKNVKEVKRYLIVGLGDVAEVYKRLEKGASLFSAEKPTEVQYGTGFGKFVSSTDLTSFLNELT
ncbi:TPA: hypothetical protein DCZ32_01570 [Candidatus Uhrbacteria bacterium]|nr:hypothetical protein [Candidatus Uhrbacteria bacterium]